MTEKRKKKLNQQLFEVPKSKGQQKKKKKKRSKKSTTKAKLFNQIFSNGKESFNLSSCHHHHKKKLDQNCKGTSIVEPSNNYSDHMDIDLAMDGSHFQEEIIMDILSRLPVRSLLRFKCVSKFWNSLISDPYFKTKHLNHAKNDQDSQKLLVVRCAFKTYVTSMYSCTLSSAQLVENVQKPDCPSSFESLHCRIVCGCDGLVIIKFTKDGGHSTLLLWNPSTKESIILPSPEFSPDGDCRFGLGFDSISGDYKVLKICDDTDCSKLTCEILSLKCASWRKIDKHPHGICNVLDGMHSLAFVHEAFHWIGKVGNYSVVTFSISNEVYGDIPLPEEILFRRNNTCIGVSVLEGMLCVHSTSFRQRKDTFKLWALKDYGIKESWNALFIIEDPCIYNAIPKYRFLNGDVLYWCIHSKRWGNAFRTSRGSFGLCPQYDAFQSGIALTESLISPKSLT